MRTPQPPPLLAPAGGDLYSELDDLLLIDRPAGDDRTAVRPASNTAVRDGRF